MTQPRNIASIQVGQLYVVDAAGIAHVFDRATRDRGRMFGSTFYWCGMEGQTPRQRQLTHREKLALKQGTPTVATTPYDPEDWGK